MERRLGHRSVVELSAITLVNYCSVGIHAPTVSFDALNWFGRVGLVGDLNAPGRGAGPTLGDDMGDPTDFVEWEDWDDHNPSLEAASWWTRGKAALIDGLIFMAPMLVPVAMTIAGFVAASEREASKGLDFTAGTTALVVLGIVLGLGVLVWAGWLFGYRQGVTGTTPGKRRLGIHLVDAASGEAPGGPKGVGRWLVPGLVGGIQGIGNIAQLIDYLWPLWDSKKQRLTDKAFRTRVVVGTPATPGDGPALPPSPIT